MEVVIFILTWAARIVFGVGLFLFLIYTGVKIGTYAFYRGRSIFFNEQENKDGSKRGKRS